MQLIKKIETYTMLALLALVFVCMATIAIYNIAIGNSAVYYGVGFGICSLFVALVFYSLVFELKSLYLWK